MRTVEQMVKQFSLEPTFCLIEVQANPERTDGGLYFAERYAPWQPHGTVVAMGESLTLHGGQAYDPGFGIGETVIFSRASSRHWTMAEKRVLALCRQDDVMCVIE